MSTGSLNLAGRVPVVKKPFSDRFLYLGVALAVLLTCAVIFGFYRRIRKQQAHTEQQQMQTVAADAATSNRAQVEGQNGLSGLPVVPQSGPGATSPTSPRTPANIPSSLAGNGTAPASSLGVAPDMKPLYASGPPPLTREQMREELQAAAVGRQVAREQEAINAPMRTAEQANSGGGAPSPASPVRRVSTEDTADLNNLPPVAGMPMPEQSGLTGGGYQAQNGQEQKRKFAAAGDDEDEDTLHTTRTAPPSRWVIERGEKIPAALPSKLVSDLPGDLTAEVVRDIYDSPTQSYVEIPAGSRLVGEYNSAVSYGQNRVQVVWTAVYFPDGTWIDLDRMTSHAADGGVGLKDQIDNHWKRLIGGVALSSLLAAGLQISQNRTTSGNVLSYPSTGQEAAAAIGTQSAELGQQITSRNLNIQPTLKIRPGEIFYVSVKKNLVFDGPYRPMEAK